MKTTALALGFLALAAVAWGSNRRDRDGWERCDPDRPRVIIYEDADFRGGALVLYPGERLTDLRRLQFDNGKQVNDRISSVRIEGGASILLFDDYDFQGQVLRTTSDIRNFAYRPMPDLNLPWNDRVSSLIVTASRDRAPAPPPPNPDAMIKTAYREVLGRNFDPEGLAYYRGLVIDQGWTERMVREHMQASDEYRLKRIDPMIRRAYRDILNREPDPEGLAAYRRVMLDRNWSEQELRDALRGSQEYRDRQVARRR